MFPSYALASAYDDELSQYVGKRRKRAKDEYFNGVKPWSNSDVNNIPDSYSFYRGVVPESVISFEGGHFSSRGRGLRGHGKIKLSFNDYVGSNGLWFPPETPQYKNNKRSCNTYSKISTLMLYARDLEKNDGSVKRVSVIYYSMG
jgi:hypothetical protein